MSSDIMNNRIIRNIQYILQNFVPQKKFTISSTRDKQYSPQNVGVYNDLTKK